AAQKIEQRSRLATTATDAPRGSDVAVPAAENAVRSFERRLISRFDDALYSGSDTWFPSCTGCLGRLLGP
ncbi:MAG: hypothetical protein AAFO77_14605, partial [Pseudomonadota bacterium]